MAIGLVVNAGQKLLKCPLNPLLTDPFIAKNVGERKDPNVLIVTKVSET